MAVVTLGSGIINPTVLGTAVTPVSATPIRSATQSGSSWSAGEVDPVFTAWDKSTGISIDPTQIDGITTGETIVTLEDWSIAEDDQDLVIKYNDDVKTRISKDGDLNTGGIKFDICLVRNTEMDNTLNVTECNPLKVSLKVGQVITVDALPDYYRFDETGWVAEIVDSYGTMAYCTIDRSAKTLTFSGLINLATWTVGTKIALYNPFINYTFVGDQTVTPIVSTVGAPAWRAGYDTIGTHNGPMFRHSDGRFIILFTGYERITGVTRGRIGYVSSPDLTTWTVGNGDSYVFNYTSIPDCAGVQIGGAATPCNDGTGRYWSVIFYGKTSDGHGVLRILYYDEDLTVITFSAPILTDTGLGYAGTSIIKIGDYYHLMVNYLHPSGYVYRVIQAFKSTALEGPYTKYQDIVTNTIVSDPDMPWADHVDPGVFYDDGVNIFGIFGGVPSTYAAGTYANRIYCLLDFDRETETWTPSKKGIAIMNPQEYQSIDSTYAWASDHCGGYPSIFVDGQEAYMTLSMKGAKYQMALIKLNYYGGKSQNYVPYEGAVKDVNLGIYNLIANNVSGDNTGDQDLSVLVPYTGAVSDVDITGQKITTDSVVINDAPVNATDAATKGYVDSVVTSGIAWKEAVIDILTPLPGGAAVGDRYIDSSDDSMNEWNGAAWDSVAAVAGDTLFVSTGPTVSIGWWTYTTSWIFIGGGVGVQHNDTTSKQGGIAGEYYHMSSAQHTIATQSATTARDGYLVQADWDTFNNKQDTLTIASFAPFVGISDTNIVQINSATVADDEYAKFTANGLEGRAYADVKTDLGITFGIADGNTVKVDDPSAAATEYARFTATGVMGVAPIDVKSDIGLGSVEDTALSTWPGSANVVQLGDVTTGSWQAATVAVAYGGTGTTTSTGTGSVVLSTSPTLTTPTVNTSLTLQDGAWVGQSDGPKLTFDNSLNFLEVTGCKVGIGTDTPLHELDVRGTIVCDGDIIAYHT